MFLPPYCLFAMVIDGDHGPCELHICVGGVGKHDQGGEYRAAFYGLHLEFCPDFEQRRTQMNPQHLHDDT